MTDCSRSGGRLTRLNMLPEMPADARSHEGPHACNSRKTATSICCSPALVLGHFIYIKRAKQNRNVASYEVIFVGNRDIFVCNQALKVQEDCFKERPIKINLFCLLSKMAALIPLDGGPVTNIASRCRHFGVDFQVEIGGNVLAALPDGRRFEDTTETGISTKISEKRNFDSLFARLAPRAQTLCKQSGNSAPFFQSLSRIFKFQISNISLIIC